MILRKIFLVQERMLVMEMISQSQLESGKGGQAISGVILVNNYGINLTKKGTEYIAGKLQSGISIDFKAWGNSTAFTTMKNEEYSNVPSYISGKFDDFGGSLSIIIDTIQAIEGYNPMDFYPVVYNTEAYYDALKNLFKSKVSDKCMNLANKYLFENPDVLDRFKIEFAASSRHDNVKSGLLAHTFKVLSLLSCVQGMYPKLFNRPDSDKISTQDFIDLLYFGAMFHDIGKTVEMNYGVYQPESIVTHRFLSIEFVDKKDIVDAYDEYWYYNLVSIFLQHHGDFDDACRTSAALIIHKVDMMDAEFTILSQSIESAIEKDNMRRVKFNGKFITV